MLEIWVESATKPTVLSFERTWSEELAAAVVFLASDNSGDIAGMKITIGVSSLSAHRGVGAWRPCSPTQRTSRPSFSASPGRGVLSP